MSDDVWVRDNANDTATAKSLVAAAIARMSTDIDTMLTSRVTVVFLTPAQMKANGYTVGGDAAWGYNPGNRVVYINNQINGRNLPSEKTQYTILHELGHTVDEDMLTSSKRTTLKGLMSPSAVGVGWNEGTYINKPAECFGDTFPRAFSDIDTVLVNFYGRQIASGNHATYRTTITGAGTPSATTLAAAAAQGATNLKYTTIGTLIVDDWIQLGTGSTAEKTQITAVGTSGAGGTGLTVSPALASAWANGTALTETSPPTIVGGTEVVGPLYSITYAGLNLTQRIPAESISVTEFDGNGATMEFSVERPMGSGALRLGYTDKLIFTDLGNNRRLFGGVVTGIRNRHLPGGGNAFDIRAVSYDSWLDRRHLPKWWTTTTGTQTGIKLTSDRLIVQRIIKDGVPWLTAPDSSIASTNTNMPKMQLEAGSVRQHILSVAEQAATVADPTPRKVYVDHNQKVHYYKGTESTDAPYRIGDANYGNIIRTTSGNVAYWPMGEPQTSSTAYDARGVADMALNGFYVRGVDPGVVNEPQKGAVYFPSRGYGLASAAAIHPGNTFSVEVWFKRTEIGREQQIFDAGVGDFRIGFEVTNEIKVEKRGTGQDFITTATFTDASWHHLVVTHSGSATQVFVDGVSKAGTASLLTMVPTTNDLYIGQTPAGGLRLNASLQHAAIYSSVLSSATILSHYRYGRTLVPDYIEHDIDYNDSGFSVYVAGSGVSGWAPSGTPWVSPYGANTIIDRPEVTTSGMLQAAATAFLASDFAPQEMIRFELSNYHGWRVGQTVSILDDGLEIEDDYQIRSIELRPNAQGTDNIDYVITAGALPWSGTFDIKRKNRRGRSGSSA